MIIKPVLGEATSGVEAIFGAMALFSCVTGSSADSLSESPRSDIDLVVVLHDHVDLHSALSARAEFTRFYIGLHRDYGYTPDLKWPGEVLYRRDLDNALRGATFARAARPDAVPPLCTHDQPYRYWVSMIATGIPLTGTEPFTSYAQACAILLAKHATAALANETYEPRQYWAESWHLPIPCEASRTWRIARHTQAKQRAALAQSAPRPYQSAASPGLERYADYWSRIAQYANHSCSQSAPNPR
ncbi:hypothetical protein [Amycolatopsis palatopharyngis]|uniref:hypothetical protein n=1 Tax=Amycolatopsis palatopharyngis TaxID=187982 RepID=UPI0013BE924C|nr:hypothetical protein [Amycolatopsis palatopharyngis]